MKNYLVSIGFIFTLALIIIASGCEKNDEVPFVDTPVTLDTLAHEPDAFELFLGSYRGDCYSYRTAFNYMTSEQITTHDTFENLEVKLVIQEGWENRLAFTVGGDYFFYPNVFFFLPAYFDKDTVTMGQNISYRTLELTWVKSLKSLHASQFNADYFSMTPGYSTFNCYCTKEE